MWLWQLVPIILILITSVSGFFKLWTRRPEPVVAYVAQDQVYAEPLFDQFKKQSGTEVRAVFDSEAVKTVGLANRLIAERNHPQCDVFWGNEELRTRLLAAKGVLKNWIAFGHRSRRLVINTKLVSPESAPKSLLELTNTAWRGKVALSYPQFGTTATHFHALRQLWGDSLWERWCKNLASNKPLIVDGNSVVVKMVGEGEAAIGMTDSDDIAAGQADGLPLAALPENSETLLIPNTAGIIVNAPHAREGQKLLDFLAGHEVAETLVAAHALESTSTNGPGKTLKVDWNALLKDMDKVNAKLGQCFLR